MVLPARRRRGILRVGAVVARGAGLEGVGMGRVGWVQHLMAGLEVSRWRSRFPEGMTERKTTARASGVDAESEAEADSQRE